MRSKLLFSVLKELVAPHLSEADAGSVADLCACGGDFFFFFF